MYSSFNWNIIKKKYKFALDVKTLKFKNVEIRTVFKNTIIENNSITKNKKLEQINNEIIQKHIKNFLLTILTITYIENFFYVFVKLSILLITKFKISYFIKHVIFFKITFLFLHLTKFFKYINNCFKFNFSKFLFKLYYQKLLKKLIK